MSDFNKAPNCATIKAPCYHCSDRTEGCHERCTRYRDYLEEFHKAKKKEDTTGIFTDWSYTRKWKKKN